MAAIILMHQALMLLLLLLTLLTLLLLLALSSLDGVRRGAFLKIGHTSPA